MSLLQGIRRNVVWTSTITLPRAVRNALVLELLVYFVAALTPLLWFHGGAIITGGDIDYPFDPVTRLQHRAFVWDRLFYGGTDLSLNASTLAFTLIEALPYFFTDNLVATEMFAFVVWFMALGLSMAYLVSALFPGKRLLRVVAVFFYMFNFYQFSNWESFRIGELSAAVLLPFVLGAATNALQHRIRLPAYALALAAVFLICMGVGVQPPMLMVVAVTMAAFIAVESAATMRWRENRERRFFAAFAALTAGVPLLVSAHWLLPELNFIARSGYGNSSTASSVYALGIWLDMTSHSSSIAHNLRLMGQFVGYDKWGGSPYLPQLYNHFNNALIAALGLLIPIAAFATLAFNRSRVVLFFASAALVTVFLSKGLHAPWGDFYQWLALHVPGFWVFRSPWEKFALVTAISYAVLIALTIEKIAAFAPTLAWRRAIGAGAIIAIVGYHYPLVTGGMFPSTGERGSLPGFHQTIPPYVMLMADWVRREPGDFSIATYPTDHSSAYNWGYGSPLDITTRLFDKNVIAPQYGQGVAPPHPGFAMSNRLSEALYEGNSNAFNFFADLLDVQFVLQRNDSLRDLTADRIDDPAWMSSHLASIDGLRLAQRVGNWDMYEVGPVRGHPRISLADRVIIAGAANPDPRSAKAYGAGLDALANAIPAPPTRTAIVEVADWQRGAALRDLRPFVAAPDISARGSTGALAVANADVHIAARFYPSTKYIVLPAGGNDPEAIVNDTHFPFRFAGGAHDWYVSNATVLYVQSGVMPAAIQAIYDSSGPISDISGVVWRDGWLGFDTRPFAFPITIPANRRAIVEINHQVTDRYVDVVTEAKTYHVRVQTPQDSDANAGFRMFRNPGEERGFAIQVFENGTYDVRVGVKNASGGLTRLEVDGRPVASARVSNGLLRFPKIHFKRGLHPARIALPASAEILNFSAIAGYDADRSPTGAIAYDDVNPTMLRVSAAPDRPSMLVFDENHNSQWMLFDGRPTMWCLLSRCNVIDTHLLVNGYANGWVIPAGHHNYTIVYWPQMLLYVGAAIEILTMLLLIGWDVMDRRRLVFRPNNSPA